MEVTRRERNLVFIALMLGILLAALDQTIVSTALPTIVGDFGGLAHYSWIVTSYLLASTISTPIWGKLSDTYGHKRVYQIAILTFLAGSALAGLSINMGTLIATRALQGIGAGGLFVGAQAIISDVVTPRERGRYQGIIGSVFGVASIIGPLLGGFIVDNTTWRWVFYLNLPVGAVALVVLMRYFKHTANRNNNDPIDYLGALFLGMFATSIILVTSLGGTEWGWLVWQNALCVAAGLFGLIAFIWNSRRAKDPLIPLGLFRDRVFSLGAATSFLVGFAMFGTIVFAPLYYQVVKGASATASGLLLIPMVVGILIASITTGQLISRTGRYKIYPPTGTLLMSIGLLQMHFVGEHAPYWQGSIALFTIGLGLGCVMQNLVLILQNSVSRKMIGVATSTATFARSIGAAVGVATYGAIFNHGIEHEFGGSLPSNASASPQIILQLPDTVKQMIVHGFAHALQDIYPWALPITGLAFILTIAMPQRTLKTTLQDEEAPPTEPM